MNVQRLCPVYKKWLQLNPSNARQHRYAMQAQTQQAHQQGRLDYARRAVWEGQHGKLMGIENWHWRWRSVVFQFE